MVLKGTLKASEQKKERLDLSLPLRQATSRSLSNESVHLSFELVRAGSPKKALKGFLQGFQEVFVRTLSHPSFKGL